MRRSLGGPRAAPAAWCAVALAAGLLAGDLVGGRVTSAAPGWAGLASVALAAAAALPMGRRGRGHARGSGAALLIALALVGWGRGAEQGRAAEAQLAGGAGVEGLVWASGLIRLEGGRPVLVVSGLRCPPEPQARSPQPALRVLLQGDDPRIVERLLAAGPLEVEGLVRVDPPAGPRGPGGFDHRGWLRAASLGATGRPVLLHLGEPVGGRSSLGEAWGVRGVRAGTTLRGWISRALGAEAGPFAAAFLLGSARSGQTAPAHTLWRCGAGHLLAVSGLHVGLVAAVLAGGLALLPCHPRWRWLALAAALLSYAWLLGPRVSVGRAATAGSLWALLRAHGRRPASITLLAVAAALSLWSAPGSWRLPGWQLSYLISAALVALARSPRPAGRTRRLRALLEGTTGLVAAQATAWPLVLAHFGWGSPFFLISNGLLIPLCALLLPILLTSLLLCAAPGFPGDVAAAPASAAVGAFLGLAARLADLCDLWIVGVPLAPGAGFVAAGIVALICGIGRWHGGLRTAVIAAGVTALTLICAGREPGLGAMAVDVGQGECWALAAAGETWVVDLGPPPGVGGRPRWALSQALRRVGRARIDRLFLSHADGDHVGGIEEILTGPIRVARIHPPADWPAPAPVRAQLAALVARGAQIVPLAAGDLVAALGDPRVVARVLHPPRGAPITDDNAGSLALAIDLGGLRLLLCGDAPAEVQLDWLEREPGLCAEVLSAAHHGSRGATPAELLERTRPRLLVVSAGRGNAFGHPHAEVLERAAAAGVPLWRTDRHGTVQLHVAGDLRRARRWGDGATLVWRDPPGQRVP